MCLRLLNRNNCHDYQPLSQMCLYRIDVMFLSVSFICRYLSIINVTNQYFIIHVESINEMHAMVCAKPQYK